MWSPVVELRQYKLHPGGGREVLIDLFDSRLVEPQEQSLPVREGEHVFAWFAGFADGERLDRASTRRSLLHGRSPRTERRRNESASSSAPGR